MVDLSYGATSLFTTCSVLEIWWLKLQLKSCSEMGVPVLRPPENVKTGRIMGVACLKFHEENVYGWEGFLPQTFPHYTVYSISITDKGECIKCTTVYMECFARRNFRHLLSLAKNLLH